MSLMANAIQKIGIAMERRKSRSLVQDFLREGICTLEEFREKPTDVKHKLANFNRLPLSLEEIQTIVKDYPYHLSKEVVELYRYANGCFPIGSYDNADKDWESPEYYCALFDSGIPVPLEEGLSFLSLQDAMGIYKSYFSQYGYDPRFFPIFGFSEYLAYGIFGGESPLESSPIVEVSLEGKPDYKQVCSSITGLFQVYAESVTNKDIDFHQLALDYGIDDERQRIFIYQDQF